MPVDIRLLRVGGMIVLCGCTTPAQTADLGTPPALIEEITAAEHAWARGVIEADTVALGRILAPEFVLVGPDGDTSPPFPRAAWMTNVATKQVYTDSVVIDSLRITGTADSAIATMRYFWRPIVRGERMPDDWTSLKDTWVRRDGRWQAVQRQRLDALPDR